MSQLPFAATPSPVNAPTGIDTLTGLAHLPGLTPSPRMPVLFVGHGSPMNVIEDTRWRRGWQALGQQFGSGPGAKYPKPQLILAISAHWITRGWQVTGMAQPATIHDFGGFPQALFDMQYPAPGWPAVADGISAALRNPPVDVDEHQWGLDHGTWSVLQPMFPAADIPVIQLSMDYSRPPQEHLALGQQLRALREQLLHEPRRPRLRRPRLPGLRLRPGRLLLQRGLGFHLRRRGRELLRRLRRPRRLPDRRQLRRGPPLRRLRRRQLLRHRLRRRLLLL
jgi:hypothetical protein